MPNTIRIDLDSFVNVSAPMSATLSMILRLAQHQFKIVEDFDNIDHLYFPVTLLSARLSYLLDELVSTQRSRRACWFVSTADFDAIKE